MTSSRTHLNMPSSTIVTIVWILAMGSSIGLWTSAQIFSYRCPHKKANLFYRRGHEIGRRLPVHVPGHMSLNYCRTPSVQFAGAPWCCKHGFMQPQHNGFQNITSARIQHSTGGGPRHFDDSRPKADIEVELIPTLADRIRIIPWSLMTRVSTEHTIKCKVCFICPRNILRKILCLSHPQEDHMCSISSGTDLIGHKVFVIVQILVQCGLRFSKDLVSQPKFCHLHWLVSANFVDKLHSHVT
jgi:hypothetical protein